MSNTPENDKPISTEVQLDKQELCLTPNSAHVEVPTGSLVIQDAFMDNQPEEQQAESQRSGTEEITETGKDVTVSEQSVTAGDDVMENQVNQVERREELADEGITSMSVQVRSGAQVSVACGEADDHASNEAHSLQSKANSRRSSPIFQYSSDAAATGL